MPGLTPVEAHVMDMWDAGMGSIAIARATGARHDRIARIVGVYHDDGEHGRERKAMARACSRLAAAINRERLAA